MHHNRAVLQFSFVLFSAVGWNTQALAQEISVLDLPLQSSTARPTKPITVLSATVTNEISRDWSNSKMELANTGAPDHSFNTAWVRIFPLPSVPLNDPYPQTVDMNSIDFTSTDGLEIYNLDTQALLGSTKTLHLNFSQATFKIGSASLAMQKLWIVPTGTATTTVQWDQGKLTGKGAKADVGVKLRGQFAVKPTNFSVDANGKPVNGPGQTLWSVINLVNINSYIESVVPSEIISSWSTETLRAQAIAARTYGTFEIADARTRTADWDMDPTTWYQSYRGVEFWDRTASVWRKVELSTTTSAVTDTANEVITYQGQVIKAYFSANSGGTTCTVAECFELPDLPYIQQIQDASGVESMPGGTWGTKATLTPAKIHDVLVANGITPPAEVARLEALHLGPSGRTWTLRVHFASGSPVDLTKLQTRQIMHLYGPIRSFLYKLGTMSGGTQEISGHGFGHGVGLSQWGAQTFAKQGWTAHKILLYYYKNVVIQKL